MPSVKRASTSSDPRVLRTGNLRIKKRGVLSWAWKVRSVTLTDKALVTPGFKIPLDRITKLERVDVKPYCLLLQTANRRYLLSFESDSDLYDWQDDVYSRCPLIGAGNPFGFQHNAHMGFDKTGTFESTGVPAQWLQPLGIQPQNDKENAKPKSQGRQHHRRDSSQAGTSTLHESTPSLPYKPTTMKTIPIAEKLVETPTISGQYNMRVQGLVVGWKWKSKYLTLGPKTLKVAASKTSRPTLTLNLRDITRIDRTDLTDYCLMLEIKASKQYFLSFKHEDQLWEWQDSLYSRSPLAGISSPSDFVHQVHIGYDPNSGEFSGVPEQWRGMLDGSDKAKAAPIAAR